MPICGALWRSWSEKSASRVVSAELGAESLYRAGKWASVFWRLLTARAPLRPIVLDVDLPIFSRARVLPSRHRRDLQLIADPQFIDDLTDVAEIFQYPIFQDLSLPASLLTPRLEGARELRAFRVRVRSRFQRADRFLFHGRGSFGSCDCCFFAFA